MQSIIRIISSVYVEPTVDVKVIGYPYYSYVPFDIRIYRYN